MNRSRFQGMIWISGLLLLCAASWPAAGQDEPFFPGQPLPGLQDQWQTGPAWNTFDRVQVTAQFTEPTEQKPARLFVQATIDPGYHIYSLDYTGSGPTAQTAVKVTGAVGIKRVGTFQAYPPAEEKPVFDSQVPMHEGSVIFYAPIELADGVNPQNLKIEGTLHALPCTDNKCEQPLDIAFTALKGPGMEIPEVATAPSKQIAEPLDLGKLAQTLAFAFLGGLILNLMPCVLPVISLKILSFLEQAGESRARVLALNVWYCVGLLSVFMVLAALAATLGLAWGEQFTLPWFKVVMTGLVFVMALSFLGVWEIPIPGFIGRGRAGQLQTKEGAGGAFFKGVFATILATPCSAPFLGPVFGFLLDQPPYMAYLVFTAVGLGMASPYLLIGAFPRLIRFLPKPGAWMATFQQVMAFLLLGTVVYLFTTLSATYFVPTLTLLIGLWFACWLIGRTPLTAGPQARSAAWGGGMLVAALVGLFAFTVLLYESKMPWKPFSPAALAQARAEGKTVMVDFSADWCLTCKTNLKFAVDTQAVRDLVEKNQVVPMLGDWTDRSPMIKQAINDLGYNSIPVLAVWPAEKPDSKVIVLADLLSQSDVLEALKAAGPSRPEEEQEQSAGLRGPANGAL
ncbi:MAG TPA: thioredoxin family protein [Thermoguttaceae bacterium]|nr:thioredoxin family protein [Thermoguttaceae bacterium]